MPQDTLMNDFRRRRIGKTVKRCLIPRRCFLSGKQVWLQKCVVVTTMLTGPGDVIFTDYWCDQKEYFLDEIKGKTWVN